MTWVLETNVMIKCKSCRNTFDEKFILNLFVCLAAQILMCNRSVYLPSVPKLVPQILCLELVESSHPYTLKLQTKHWFHFLHF